MKTLSESLTEHARGYLRECLERTGGKVPAAAIIAGIHRSTFYSLCARCGVVINKTTTPTRASPLKAFSVWLGSKGPT